MIQVTVRNENASLPPSHFYNTRRLSTKFITFVKIVKDNKKKERRVNSVFIICSSFFERNRISPIIININYDVNAHRVAKTYELSGDGWAPRTIFALQTQTEIGCPCRVVRQLEERVARHFRVDIKISVFFPLLIRFLNISISFSDRNIK